MTAIPTNVSAATPICRKRCALKVAAEAPKRLKATPSGASITHARIMSSCTKRSNNTLLRSCSSTHAHSHAMARSNGPSPTKQSLPKHAMARSMHGHPQGHALIVAAAQTPRTTPKPTVYGPEVALRRRKLAAGRARVTHEHVANHECERCRGLARYRVDEDELVNRQGLLGRDDSVGNDELD
eukprot:1942960-Pleurochrysis_carterae.AAC.1